MTWSVDHPQGNESYKIRWECVEYTRGKVLDLGCGIEKLYPHFLGIDNRKDEALFGHPIRPDVTLQTAENLDIFASQSMDSCFSSHLLEHIEPHNVSATLKEWMRVIKPKGYLVLYLPDEDEYPKVGEKDANPDHKWNVNYDLVISYMRAAGSWDLIDFQKRNQDKEYSLYFVFKKIGSGQFESWKKKPPRPEKTCGIVRYGAFGDLLQASSVFSGLKSQGYHVTLYTSPPGDDVVRNDPNIDAFYLQDKDQVPNPLLGQFWDYHAKRYDKWINLSESVEGSLLALPGRIWHGWPPALRHQMMDKNYLELQHMIAGVQHIPKVRFFPTDEEKTWARKQRSKMGEFVIAWPLAGSSCHKVWSGLDHVVASIMLDFPQVHIVFMGGEAAKILEQGWEKESRVHRKCGEWSIRQSLAFMDEVDMAIGPETGVMNCASHMPYPKIVFLSHSSHENLTRDWPNVHPLTSENTTCPGRGNNEAPTCHQLHYGWTHCKKTEDGTAQCQKDITPDQAYRVIWHTIKHELEQRQVA